MKRMENFDTQPSTEGHIDRVRSVFLFVFALMSHWLQNFNFNVFYDYAFKTMTLISLALIVVINWNKMLDLIRKRKKK